MAATAKKLSTGAIHAIAGSDEIEVKRAARQLADRLVSPEAGDFAREIIDGAAENVDQAATRIHQTIEALLTLPFFGSEKLVWLKNANCLADSVLGRSQSVLDALEKLQQTLAAGLPDNVKFLLSAVDVDKRRSFFKSLSKLGKVETYDRADPNRSGWEEDAARSAESRARDRGLRFSEEALEVFTLFTGGESRQMENELEKLELYLGKTRAVISADEVRLLVPVSRAGVIFELGNAIAACDLRRGLALLDQLLYQGEKAVGILLVAIIPTVRNLLLVKDLMQRHRLNRPQMPFHFTAALNRLSEDATQHLPRKKDGTINGFALGIAAMHAHRHSLGKLREHFSACLQANVQLVTTQVEERVILSELIARIAAKAAK